MAEGEALVPDVAEGGALVPDMAEGERPVEDVAAGEQPVEDVAEGELPVVDAAEGERPVVDAAEGERLVANIAEGERPVGDRGRAPANKVEHLTKRSIRWQTVDQESDFAPIPNQFSEQTGPVSQLPSTPQLIDFFYQLIDTTVLQLLVDETNRYINTSTQTHRIHAIIST